jgi:DNA/RNA endonuclease YhcR with UshA esterase domain
MPMPHGMRWRSPHLGPGPLAVLFVALICMVASAAPETDAPEVPVAEAGRHVGELARVCGQVASVAHMASVNGQPTFLNLDRPYPDQVFTVVIWGRSRSRFDSPPERFYDGKSICVTGRIDTYRGKPQIIVEDPAQIVLTSPEEGSAGGSELDDLERVWVKALLASLGYEANYGSSEWDEATVEAVIAFQEASGLAPTGEPDAVTLRELAGKVGEIPEIDRTMVIRLILLELARRQE